MKKAGYIIEIPFEPRAKRAPVYVQNRTSHFPIITDPDRLIKLDTARWIFDNCELPTTPMTGALKLDMLFRLPVPNCSSRKERERRLAFQWAVDNKKDLDNMQKLYQDALNFGPLKGRIFEDDHQICYARTYKFWSENPGIVVCLENIIDPFTQGL